MTSNVQSKITGLKVRLSGSSEFFISATMNQKTLNCIHISKTWANGGFYYPGITGKKTPLQIEGQEGRGDHG